MQRPMGTCKLRMSDSTGFSGALVLVSCTYFGLCHTMSQTALHEMLGRERQI